MVRKQAANTNRGNISPALVISLAILMLLSTASFSHAALNVSPGSVEAVKGKNTSITLTWTLTGVADNTWSSTQGFFETPTAGLGTTGPLSIVVTGGSGGGSVTESLTIPSAIVAAAASGGNSSFTYRREFRSFTGALGGTTSLSITIRFSQAAGPVSLRRVELYFEEGGRRTNEITVKRNAKGFLALADLYFNGTGYIEGYWEVDGRRIENIREYASFGSKVTVRSSEIPGLPTFRPGLHSVNLVISNPTPEFTLPQIGYIVTAGSVKTIQPLHPLSPEDEGEVNGSTIFSWNPGAGAVYVLTFTGDSDGDVVLTAQTKDPDYRIPPQLLADRFTTGGTYFWQIQGYGADGELVSEGRSRKFTVVE